MKPTLLIVLFLIFMLSCNTEPDMSDSGILVSRAWKIESLQNNGRETITECMEDDCYSFKKDGSLVILHGANKCTDVESPGGSYWFYDNETLVISSNGDRIYYKVFIYTDEIICVSDAAGSRMVYTYVPCN